MEFGSSPYKSLGIDAIFQYTGSGVQLFSGTVFYLIVARIFNTSGVGAIALFVAVIGLFNIIFTFGLNAAAQHFTSYNLGRGDFPSVKMTIYKFIGYGVLLSFIGLISLIVLAPIISQVFLHSVSYTELVRLLSLVLFGNILFGILNGSLLGIQGFRVSALINIAIWVTYYFGAILFALLLHSIETIIIGWIIGIFFGVLLEFSVVLASVHNYLGKGSPPSSTFVLSYSLPILLSGLISYGAASVDRFVVSGLLSLSSLGVYNFALLIVSSIGFLSAPFNNILMTKFSELYGGKKLEEISSTTMVSSTLLSSLYIPLAMGIAALAPLILNLLAGISYIGGVTPLRIMVVVTGLFITQNILIQTVASVRKTRLLVYSGFLALISNLSLSIILIPRYGLTGAAIGYSSVFATTFFVLYFYLRRENLVELDKIALLKIWIASCLMFFIVVGVSDLFSSNLILLPLYIGLGAISYMLIARCLRIFKTENKQLILSIFPQNHRKLLKVISFFILY